MGFKSACFCRTIIFLLLARDLACAVSFQPTRQIARVPNLRVRTMLVSAQHRMTEGNPVIFPGPDKLQQDLSLEGH